MAIQQHSGTPVIGYVSLSPGTPGPVAFALFTVMGQAPYTLQAQERVYITNITVSSSDTSNVNVPIIVVDTGGTTPTKLTSAYVNNVKPLQPIQIPAGICRGIFGVVPRAGSTISGAPSVSAGTVEIIIKGYVSRT